MTESFQISDAKTRAPRSWSQGSRPRRIQDLLLLHYAIDVSIVARASEASCDLVSRFSELRRTVNNLEGQVLRPCYAEGVQESLLPHRNADQKIVVIPSKGHFISKNY